MSLLNTTPNGALLSRIHIFLRKNIRAKGMRKGELTMTNREAYEIDCEELEQYRKIGTVEECREAVEKQKAKKPKDSLKINPVIDGNGAYVDADTTVYLLCPNCGELVGEEENCDNYCRECGQKIDKESEEE